MKKLTITKGWFRAAGNIFKWSKSYHVFGVGIDMELLNKEPELLIVIDKLEYILNSKIALKFVQDNQTYKEVGKGRKLGVVSKSLLVPVNNLPVYSQRKPKPPITKGLFE